VREITGGAYAKGALFASQAEMVAGFWHEESVRSKVSAEKSLSLVGVEEMGTIWSRINLGVGEKRLPCGRSEFSIVP